VRRLFLVLPLVLLMAAGCVRHRPKTQPQPASLEVPPPPARVVVPPEPEEPPDETVTEPPAATARRPTRPRPAPPRERTEAKPAETKEPPAEAARPPATTPVPLGPLQPVLPAPPGEMERRVNDQLVQAKRDLDRVDYRALSTDARSQYDTAKRFIEQASQALKERNFLFAAKLAEKAVGLASGLVARRP
jgi:hypothetical protein